MEADRARRRAGRAVSRPPGGGGDRLRRLPRALPRQPRKPGSRDPRQVGGGDARVARDRSGDRRRGSGLPRGLAPRRRSRGGSRARGARASRAARADRRPALAGAGELRRSRRDDRALGRRARRDRRAAGRPPPPRDLPRLLPLVGLRGRRDRPRDARRRARRARRAHRPRPAALPARQRRRGRPRLEPRPSRGPRRRDDRRGHGDVPRTPARSRVCRRSSRLPAPTGPTSASSPCSGRCTRKASAPRGPPGGR